MPPKRKIRLKRTCTITRPPVAGESEETAVATDLACSVPYPIAQERKEREQNKLGTMAMQFEIFTDMAAIESFDKLVTNGRTFFVVHASRWESSRTGRTTYMRVIGEELSN